MTSDIRNDLGARGEDLAAQHLSRRGFQILERNFRTRWGELDLIAFDGHALVFCEVKTRRVPCSSAAALDSVHARKRAQLRKMAGRWLIERRERPYADELRFDAIGVTLDAEGRLVELDHVEGAF